jgi:Xaa-Pro aminopeptidase
VNALRARKSDAELALIKKAAEISAEGHKELMKKATEGSAEYDYQATIEGAFLRGGRGAARVWGDRGLRSAHQSAALHEEPATVRAG